MNPPEANTETGLFNEQAFTETLVLPDDEDTPAAADAGGSKSTGISNPTAGDTAAGDEAQADESLESDQPSWIGKKLGRFKLLRMLGQGGMGIVIQAQDIHLGRIVALKILRKQIKGVDDGKHVEQFLREAKSAAQIQHPNAAQIYEINQHKGWWYIATEMIEGGTLDQVVKASGKLDPEQACPLIADAASVLAVAHQGGIIHRDIKPHNLMLTRMGRCKVVDFGLVRLDDPNDPFDFTERAVGTPDYLPPEAAARKCPTPAYDIYSLGATLYYALTGRPPFKAKSIIDLVKLHTTAPRPDAREINPHCSERLAKLIQRAMAVDPEERPSAQEIASSLRLESIGTSFDPSSLVLQPDGTPRFQHADETELTDAGISALPLTSTTHSSRILGTNNEGPFTVEGHRRDRWTWIIRGAIATVVVGVLIKLGFMVHDYYDTEPDVRDNAAFIERFSNAPDAYGTRQPDTQPPASPTAPTPAPAFSWLGQTDPGDNRYVASRSGNHAYRIDHPAAALIRNDLARFFATADDARAAGKTVVGE